MFDEIYEFIEMIGNLLAIGFWIVSIAAFVVGIIACIYKLIKGSIGAKCLAVIGAILGVVAFIKMYDWTEHIAWCMFASGFVACFFTGVLNDEDDAARKEPKQPGVIETFADGYVEAYIQRKIIEEGVERGIRKSKE